MQLRAPAARYRPSSSSPAMALASARIGAMARISAAVRVAPRSPTASVSRA
jgi:hypothetical protein